LNKNNKIFNQGIFLISIDLELAWGICDKKIPTALQNMIENESIIVDTILRLFNKYNITATWAIVAHLLSRAYPKKNGLIHPEFKRPFYKNSKYDWFSPFIENFNENIWYAKDIINKIRMSTVKQDFGCHSFCHIPYDEKNVNSHIIRQDLLSAKQIFEEYNLPFENFVFPRNIIGFKDELKKNGIKTYRGLSKRWYYSIPFRPLVRLFNYFYYLFKNTPPTVTPSITDNMLNIPDSLLFLSRDGLRSFIPKTSIVKMCKKGIDNAIVNKEMFHLWFHPSNFYYKTQSQFEIFEEIISYVNEKCKSGHMKTLSMTDVQKYILPF